MPTTAITPFRADISRSRALVQHAVSMASSTEAQNLLRDDVLRSGWMFAVGAMDAYFCDAYADLIAATLMAKSHEPSGTLETFVEKIEIPVAAVLEDYTHRHNWRWRMAARRMMAAQDALKLDTIRNWFNPFFQSGQKFFSELIPIWIARNGATERLFGIVPSQFLATSGAARNFAQRSAKNSFENRFKTIVQRRHDCIHTCDRPLSSPQTIHSAGTVSNVIRDVEFIVSNADAHIDYEYRCWLARCGFSALTTNRVGY